MYRYRWTYFSLIWLLSCWLGFAQEEESAEVYLEAYTDTFQERFFEALKEKGIENYDKAEALLLECKQMHLGHTVVDHELARVLAAREQYAAAESYAVAAVSDSPSEYWYMKTLLDILAAQYKTPAALSEDLPLDMPALRMNIAKWHLAREEGEEALEYLRSLPRGTRVDAMRQRARQFVESAGEPDAIPVADTPETPADTDMEDFKARLERLLASRQWEAAATLGAEAVELYPLQPHFYAGRGEALLNMEDVDAAEDVLLLGEQLLLEGGPTAVRIYRALEQVYTALGKPEKAAEYRTKIKIGSW